ncbi:MAG: histidine--tRNA ligase [Pseudomonadota bacterium]
MEFITIKGFKDILPDEVGTWQRLELEARKVFRCFGFKEIKPPILEKTELFSRSIGEDTDIVAKEMYSFKDIKERDLTLRPEATASVVRAYIQHRLYEKNPVQKLFTIGPMFRHERPQKGRLRQFHQINAEILGDPGPRSDADLIVMAMALLESLGLSSVTLNLNSLGCPACRISFKQDLQGYLSQKADDLCPDCKKRAHTNPLRVFDCKVETCTSLFSDAPSILDYICEDCQGHFHSLQDYLSNSEIPFVLNPKLVRGLDYYTRTTFEIQTSELGAQNAIAGGGRYDGLVTLLGGPDHPAIGFAMGMERLVALLGEGKDQDAESPALFIAALGEQAERVVFKWISDLRRSGIWVEMDYATKGLKGQMKKADRLGAERVVIIGDNELTSGKAILRDMRTKIQEEVRLVDLVDNLKKLCC